MPRGSTAMSATSPRQPRRARPFSASRPGCGATRRCWALSTGCASTINTSGESAKAVVWAHNSHIGNAAATAMGWQGAFNIGELCRTAYGDEAVLIGFGTDRGTVAAADDWDGEMRIKTVIPARPDSWEFAFRKAGHARSLTDWRRTDRRELIDALREPRLERGIGVIYR